MVSGRHQRERPVDLVDDWVDGTADDPVVEAVRAMAARLREAIDGRSVRSVMAGSDLTHQAVTNVLAGRTWPEAATILRLEQWFGVRLWPEGVLGKAVAEIGGDEPAGPEGVGGRDGGVS